MDNEDSPAIIGYHNHTNKGTVNCEKKIQIQELETWIEKYIIYHKDKNEPMRGK